MPGKARLFVVSSYIATAFISTLAGAFLTRCWYRYKKSKSWHGLWGDGSPEPFFNDEATDEELRVVDGVAGLVGNTPMIKIKSLSDATGCDIWAKVEFLNPSGSSKDRIALSIIERAEAEGQIRPHAGYTIFEGTVGSTGIALAMLSKAKGYHCHIVLPNDQAKEKYQLLQVLGAELELVPPVSIVDRENQFVNLAKKRAATDVEGTSFFADQFENLANFEAHLRTTGPEILKQTKGKLDAVVLGAGTGGTIAGVSRSLKPRLPDLKVFLADPEGSGLYHKVKHNVMYCPLEAEGSRRRHQVDSIVEGVGINRLTSNFQQGLGKVYGRKYIDDAIRVSDREAVEMSRWVMREDGLFIGSSSAVNLVGAVRVAKLLGPGHRIVTMLSDSGQRHLTKFWNPEVVESLGISPVATTLDEVLSPANSTGDRIQ